MCKPHTDLPAPNQKPTPEFFIYYGERSVVSNNELLATLTEEDVSHLSQAEKDFFALWKSDPFEFHSGFCSGPRPTQEEECQGILNEMCRG